jgi:predicted peptidase
VIPVNYLLYLPKDYDAKSDKRWPVILFLHGAGERGTNIWKVDFHGPSKYIMEHPEFPFILVTPQCPADQSWSNEALLKLLDEILAKYKADPTRVYLTGLSMGGYGTWSLGTTYPERFAAIAPICGGGQSIQIILAARGYTPPERAAALKTLAVWAFHGAKDTVVPSSESEHMLEALKGASVEEIHYTVYPEKQHDSWTETYNNPELYKWFLKHRREPVSTAKK